MQAFVKSNPQRWTQLFQVKEIEGEKRALCQVTDKQFRGDAAKAKLVCKTLCKLYNQGASKDDLQRCKLSGNFYGMAIGRPMDGAACERRGASFGAACSQYQQRREGLSDGHTMEHWNNQTR